MPTLKAPVIQHKSWRFLLREFIAENGQFRAFPAKWVQMGMGAAVSAAWWMATYQPELAKKQNLRIIIAGAGLPECLDSGRWWQFFDWAVGRTPGSTQIVIVGNQLSQSEQGPLNSKNIPRATLEKQWETPFGRNLLPPAKVTIVNGNLSEALAASKEPFDLCLMFAPGFESHYESWLVPDELLALLNAKVPVGIFSYSEMDAQADQFILAACGVLPVEPMNQPNPWQIPTEASEFIGNFAGVAWRLVPKEVPVPFNCQSELISDYLQCAGYLRPELERGGDLVLTKMGQLVTCELEDEFEEDMYCLPKGTFVCKEDGLVLVATGEFLESFEPELYIPLEVLALRPKSGHMAQMMWAVHLHQDYVRPHSAVPNVLEQLRAVLGDAVESPEKMEALAQFVQQYQNPAIKDVTPGSEAFFLALEHDDISQAKALVAEHPELLLATDSKGNSGAMIAYQRRHREVAIEWVTQGASPNQRDNEGFNLLYDSINDRDNDLLEALLVKKVDVNSAVGAGFTPSLVAITRQNWYALERLLDHRADLTTPSLTGMCVANLLNEIEMPEALRSRICEQLIS